MSYLYVGQNRLHGKFDCHSLRTLSLTIFLPYRSIIVYQNLMDHLWFINPERKNLNRL